MFGVGLLQGALGQEEDQARQAEDGEGGEGCGRAQDGDGGEAGQQGGAGPTDLADTEGGRVEAEWVRARRTARSSGPRSLPRSSPSAAAAGRRTSWKDSTDSRPGRRAAIPGSGPCGRRRSARGARANQRVAERTSVAPTHSTRPQATNGLIARRPARVR